MAAFLAALMLTILCLCQAAFAAEQAGIDLGRQSSLTMELRRQEAPYELAADLHATIAIYQIGAWDGARGQYVLDGEFAQSGADIEDGSPAALREIARPLAEYAARENIQPEASGRITDGTLTFEGLSTAALYLAAQTRSTGDNVETNPFVTYLPVWNDDPGNTGWQYDVTASLKYEVIPPSSENPTEPTNPGGEDPTDPANPTDPADPSQTPENPTDPTGPTEPSSGSGGNNGGNGGGGGGGSRGDRDRTGGTGDPGTNIGDDDPALANLENIADDDVPLATNPILQAIEDVLVPLGILPKTADGSVSYTPLLAVLAVSGALIVLLIVKRRKKAE